MVQVIVGLIFESLFCRSDGLCNCGRVEVQEASHAGNSVAGMTNGDEGEKGTDD